MTFISYPYHEELLGKLDEVIELGDMDFKYACACRPGFTQGLEIGTSTGNPTPWTAFRIRNSEADEARV